ncbi:1-phosphofructokinase [Cellulosilyticum sp. I15G10I2]|uniref:1-phosphofructokinase n=1 Tax=Cellulosilyticum sp. I15G10I2 TaxID=1892843 RepID=UPI00085BC397|nr:1-phosphofructokinase [Cellulosilyticum sp. I15G10I2]
MIYTVTLNPAVDKTIILSNLLVDQVNRAETVREDAGGKGINVSKMIKNLKGESLALGICAGKTGVFIQDQLDKIGIKHHFIQAEGQTRTNIKIVDKRHQTYTDINETGAPVSDEVLKQLEELIFSYLTEGDFLVLAGSVPANVSKAIYKKWIQRANLVQAKVILDADREMLREGIDAEPYLIKPNIHELEELCGQKIETIDKAIKLAKSLLKGKTEVIVISRGEKGCIVVTQNEQLMIEGLKVPVKSTVGAGDSMVAALAHALNNKASLKEAITLGVAASAATVMQEGTIMGEWDTIEALKQKINIII